MQGRESGPQAGARAVRMRWLPAALLLLAIAAAGWWWQSQPTAGDAANALPRLSLAANAGNDTDEPAMPAAATIVDDAPSVDMGGATGIAAGTDSDFADPAANPMLVMAQPDATPGAGTPATADGAPNPFVVAAAPARAAAKPAAPRRERARAARDDEPDLLAILMGNIKPDPALEKNDGSGLDAFIQTMQADDTGMASADKNRNGRPQRTRSQQIQRNLRECPAANTAKGVKCRQEICAVYAGRDPACPANG